MKTGHTKKDRRTAKLRAARKLLRALGVEREQLHERAVALSRYNRGSFGGATLLDLLPHGAAREVRDCKDPECDCTVVVLSSATSELVQLWAQALEVV